MIQTHTKSLKNIEDVDKKKSYTSGLVKKTNYNAKLTCIENKIPCIAGLFPTAAIKTKAKKIENRIPDNIFITLLLLLQVIKWQVIDVLL